MGAIRMEITTIGLDLAKSVFQVHGGGINAMNLKDRLGDVETDCRNRLHG
jgi:hypothetical protein